MTPMTESGVVIGVLASVVAATSPTPPAGLTEGEIVIGVLASLGGVAAFLTAVWGAVKGLRHLAQKKQREPIELFQQLRSDLGVERLEEKVDRMLANAVRHMPWDAAVHHQLKEMGHDPGPPPPLLPDEYHHGDDEKK